MSAEGYLGLAKALGLVEKVGADLGYYQGDYVALVTEDIGYGSGDRWGFLVIGYGSCSGCDELDAADTVEDMLKIATDMVERIRWFSTLDGAKAYITSDEQVLEWHAHESGWPAFVDSVRGFEVAR